MKTKRIKFNSNDYKKSIVLRDKILRKPLGLTYSKDFLQAEKEQIHLGLFEEENIIAILLLQKVDNQSIKMRQVAVEEDRQREGLGRQLVHYSEKIAREEGFQKIELNAREISVPFYLSLDYEICSEKFFEVGIPHYKMEKILS
jgi:predicted GNAT family N-acyltransferase